jgi:uncharacterized OsmC-like protein
MDLIHANSTGNLGCAVRVRRHEIEFDMEGGREDRGWQPAEGLVASLGACLGIAMGRYCRTLELADEGLSLYLTYQMADHPPRVSNIIIDVELPDDFPEDRKPALERILRLCPVYSTLMNPPEIDLDFG